MGARKFVAYYRVSTERQGRSGLGLDAQRASVRAFLNGGTWTLVSEHVEIESGANEDRPELRSALSACRIHGASLIIARLDRLSRDAAFLMNLQKSGVDFVSVDMPDANKLTIGVMALIAQHEREAISARTKAALAAARARGVKLGRPENLSNRIAGSKSSAEVRRARATSRAEDLARTIAELRAAGASTLRAIAEGLNERGIPAPRGGAWQPVQVQRILALTPQLGPTATRCRNDQ